MADYPRELQLDEDTLNRLSSYLDTELANHEMERGDYTNQLVEWQKDYDAKPVTEQVTFPFTGAATIIIPLSAITIEAVHARTMTTMFALDQFVTVKANHEDWIPVTRPLERMLDHELLENVKIYNPVNDALLELTKYGTGVMKTGWEKLTKVAVRPKIEKPDEEEEFKVAVKNGPTVEATPVSRFVMPFSYQNICDAPWCGEEHEADAYMIRQYEESGYFRSGITDELIGHYNQITTDEFKDSAQNLDLRQPSMPKMLKWYEIWLSFDVDQSAKTEREYGSENFPPGEVAKEIVVHYSRDTKKFFSIRYNWYSDLRKPYYKGVYFPVEHRWAGIGACKQLDQFQREITTQHRQRLDNATLANVRMIKVSTSSRYGPNEPIFPGKMWFVDEADDISTFQLGEIYPSSYSNEQATLSFAQQRGGVNEATAGMPQVGTPGTATAELSRVQESNKKFDFIYKNSKRLVKEVTLDVVSQIKQFGVKNDAYYSNVTGGDLVQKFMNMPADLIREGILVSIDIAGQQENKLLDRQNWQQLTPMVNQYFTGMIQLAQAAGDQTMVQEIGQKGMVAATEAFRQLLETFDIKNIDRIALTELLNASSRTSTQPGTNSGLVLPAQTQGSAIPQQAAPQLPTILPQGASKI